MARIIRQVRTPSEGEPGTGLEWHYRVRLLTQLEQVGYAGLDPRQSEQRR
jgi:hypothetical protein